MGLQIKTPARVSGGHGRGRIRTFEGVSHQIYSLTPLATWVHARGKLNACEYMAVRADFKPCPAPAWRRTRGSSRGWRAGHTNRPGSSRVGVVGDGREGVGRSGRRASVP